MCGSAIRVARWWWWWSPPALCSRCRAANVWTNFFRILKTMSSSTQTALCCSSTFCQPGDSNLCCFLCCCCWPPAAAVKTLDQLVRFGSEMWALYWQQTLEAGW
uniref:Putative secreted protein n=1 Tax=Anopheles marajoara TaxID=58244 RepID=A0A2M4C9E2_9DIPT